MRYDKLVNEILKSTFKPLEQVDEMFGLFKKDPRVVKYVEKLEDIEHSRDFGRIEAAEFFFDKVPSELWKKVIKMYEKRNEDSVLPEYIKRGIGRKTK
jgi:hypothetical protein